MMMQEFTQKCTFEKNQLFFGSFLIDLNSRRVAMVAKSQEDHNILHWLLSQFSNFHDSVPWLIIGALVWLILTASNLPRPNSRIHLYVLD